MSGEGPAIVLVEDNPSDAELIIRVLKQHDLAANLVILKNGAEALDFFFCKGGFAGRPRDGDPDVVFLDLKLPKVDGIEVLRQIKAETRTKTVPVVVLTSSTEERDLKAAYELGVNSYVTKPIEFKELANVVSQMGLYWLTLNRLPAR